MLDILGGVASIGRSATARGTGLAGIFGSGVSGSSDCRKFSTISTPVSGSPGWKTFKSSDRT
jgi:hypothetical protein